MRLPMKRTMEPCVSAAANIADWASPETLDDNKLCPMCESKENLTLCACGTAAYCSFEDRYLHWERHKECCKCA